VKQLPEGTKDVSLAIMQADGSFVEQPTKRTVGVDEDILFYVPYTGSDRVYLSGDNQTWVSQNSMAGCEAWLNATSPIKEASPAQVTATFKAITSEVVRELSQHMGKSIVSLTERQLDMQENGGEHCDTVALVCIFQKADHSQIVFFLLFKLLFWVLIGMVLYQCCCTRPEDEIVVLDESVMAHPAYAVATRSSRCSRTMVGDAHAEHRTTPDQIHIVEQPAHVTMEQAFAESKQDLPMAERRSPSPTVVISDEPVYNDEDGTTTPTGAI